MVLKKGKTLKKSAKKVEKKMTEEVIIETPKDEIEEVLKDTSEEIAQNKEETIEKEYLDAIVENKAVTEVMNGDPAVLTSIEEIEEEAMKETFKEVKENKTRKLNIDPFSYSWNGIEIDF